MLITNNFYGLAPKERISIFLSYLIFALCIPSLIKMWHRKEIKYNMQIIKVILHEL